MKYSPAKEAAWRFSSTWLMAIEIIEMISSAPELHGREQWWFFWYSHGTQRIGALMEIVLKQKHVELAVPDPNWIGKVNESMHPLEPRMERWWARGPDGRSHFWSDAGRSNLRWYAWLTMKQPGHQCHRLANSSSQNEVDFWNYMNYIIQLNWVKGE